MIMGILMIPRMNPQYRGSPGEGRRMPILLRIYPTLHIWGRSGRIKKRRCLEHKSYMFLFLLILGASRLFTIVFLHEIIIKLVLECRFQKHANFGILLSVLSWSTSQSSLTLVSNCNIYTKMVLELPIYQASRQNQQVFKFILGISFSIFFCIPLIPQCNSYCPTD